MDFGKLTNVTHTTKAVVDGEELTITFRGVSARVYLELEASGAVIDRDTGLVNPPEYLAVFVTSLATNEATVTPDLDFWLDAEPKLVGAVFEAINKAMNPSIPQEQ